MMKNTEQEEIIEIQNALAITPHSEALYDAGKQMLISSISTGRDFCKVMIGTSTSAIPIYIAILTFILPKEFKLGIAGGFTIAIPAIGFLIAATLFSLGYMPSSSKFSLDNIDEIENERSRTIKSLINFIYWGLGAFVISTLLSISAVIINIGVK
jgi:hypothetical protein